MLRKTFIEINLKSIKENIETFRKHIGKNVRILLPVKADAYGHGLIQVSQYVEENNLIDMLGVASLEEGIELREAGIKLPVLILGLILPDPEQINLILDNNITQTVADIQLAKMISKIAAEKNVKAKVHLKIDTGMGRIGCSAEEAPDLAKNIYKMDNIELEGIYSHFPVADDRDPQFTLKQIETFKDIIAKISSNGIRIKIKHIANSAGMTNFPGSFFDMVRPGIMTYGYLPSFDMEERIKVKPAMTFKSAIIFVKRVKSNMPISYGHIYTTDKDANIATVAVGYGDGYSRALSNKGKVVIRGKEYPVVGRVTMDQIMVNLGNDIYQPGEEVIIFGDEKITVNEIARWCNTIPYEITCAISGRVHRKYLK